MPPRLQGADLRRVPLPASSHAGGPDQRYAAPRDPGDDQQVHDRPHPHPGQTVSLPRPQRSAAVGVVRGGEERSRKVPGPL